MHGVECRVSSLRVLRIVLCDAFNLRDFCVSCLQSILWTPTGLNFIGVGFLAEKTCGQRFDKLRFG